MRTRQRGAVLVVAMIFLLIVILLGLAGSSQALSQAKVANNMLGYQVALQSAEGALKQAYAGIGGFGGFSQNANGYYQFDVSQQPVWQPQLNTPSFWADAGKVVVVAPLAGAQPAQQNAAYLVERLPTVAMPGSAISNRQLYGNGQGGATYRVTARGVGPDGNAPVVLQSIFIQ